MTPILDIHSLQKKLGAEFLTYGLGRETAVELVQDFGSYEIEYAAIRQRVAILHEPQRGILRLAGKDCKDFLHRLTTQDINKMKGGDTRRAFQLNDKGRIVADMIIHHGDADTWLETDIHDIAPLKKLLDDKLFSEDLIIEDWSAKRVAFLVQGPATLPLLKALDLKDHFGMMDMPGTTHVIELLRHKISAYRYEPCGVLGVRLLVPTENAAEIYTKLLEAAGVELDAPLMIDPVQNPEAAAQAAEQRRNTLRGRPIGWHAFNTARIEAGSPLFHVDFGTDSIPAETSLLDETVSFTKGCYLGQEIVARMKNLGHPKRVIVGIRCENEALPIAGTQVIQSVEKEGVSQGQVVGAITSSTISPLLGGTAIALASVKWDVREPGTKIVVAAEGKLVPATVQPLKFAM